MLRILGFILIKIEFEVMEYVCVGGHAQVSFENITLFSVYKIDYRRPWRIQGKQE